MHLVDKMMVKIYPKMKRQNATFSNFLFALKSHLKHPRIMLEFIVGSIWDCYGYFAIIIGFIYFLYVNGSIVGKPNETSNYLNQWFHSHFSWRQDSTRSFRSHSAALLLQLVRASLRIVALDSATAPHPHDLQKLEVLAWHSRPCCGDRSRSSL